MQQKISLRAWFTLVLFHLFLSDTSYGVTAAEICGQSFEGICLQYQKNSISTAGLNAKTSYEREQSDVYRLGSLSKAITGYAVFLLQKKNRIDLEKKVSFYLRTLSNTPVGKIKIFELITMKSALKDLLTQKPWHKEALDYKHLVELISTASLEADFKNSEYVNLNYTLLALLVKTVTGQTPIEYIVDSAPSLKNHLFNGPNRYTVNGHIRFAGIKIPSSQFIGRIWKADYDQPLDGSGNYCSTIWGITEFYKIIIYDQEFLKHLLALNTKGESYAYGWGLFNKNERLYLAHSGALSPFGYSSFITISPSDEHFIVGLSNMQSGPDFEQAYETAKKVLGIPNASINRPWIGWLSTQITGFLAMNLSFQIIPLLLFIYLFCEYFLGIGSLEKVRAAFVATFWLFNPWLLLLFCSLLMQRVLKKSDCYSFFQPKNRSALLNFSIGFVVYVYFWVY